MNLSEYKPITVPASVQKFVQCNPVSIPGASYTACSYVSWDSVVDSDLRSYEKSMEDLILAVIDASSVSDLPAPLDSSAYIYNDLLYFENYYKLKTENTEKVLTWDASVDYYDRFFGSTAHYSEVMNWVKSQMSRSTGAKYFAAQLKNRSRIGDASMAKINFYSDLVEPLSEKLSKEEREFLSDVFVFQMDGQIKLTDLVQAIGILKNFLTTQQLSVLAQFGFAMILSSDPNDKLMRQMRYEVGEPRNIQKELGIMRAYYQDIINRLGMYADPRLGDLIEQRIANYELSYRNPSDPKYFSCGDVCNQIDMLLLGSIGKALSSAVSGASLRITDVEVSAPNTALAIGGLGLLLWYLSGR